MASTQCFPTSFAVELMKGSHNFKASGGNAFKMALYDSTATLGPTTTAYTATGEISGTGYVAGGAALTNVEPTSSGTTGYTTFSNVSWAAATFTARYAMIYNTSSSNKVVAILDFGSDKTATAQTFTVQFPTADATNAIIRFDPTT